MNGYRAWLQGLAGQGNIDAQTALRFQGDDGSYGLENGMSGTGTRLGSQWKDYSRGDLENVLNSLRGQYASRGNEGSATFTGGYNAGGGSGGGGAAGASPADFAYLDDQEARLRRQLGSSSTALGNGINQINDSYNGEVSKTNEQRSRALEDFNTKREDTTRAKSSALNRVDSNARTLADSLRRRIGMASGSSSSAYQLAAPNAVSRQASEQRGGVQENYGVNFRNLGTAEDRAKSDFETLLQDLSAQRGQRESDFRSGILDRQNQIESSLAEVARQRALAKGGGYAQVRQALAPYSAAIDTRQSEIDNLFNKYRTPYDIKPVEVQNPSLRDYTTERGQISEQASAQDPYTDSLRKRQREEDALL